MSEIKVSVIIPVYNVALYLSQCVDSVLKQTLSEIEIIIVDDGSTDGSEKICDEYEKTYNNISVFHKDNGGLGSARNYGLKYAKGEYFFLLDSDDWLSENALEILYSEAKNNSLDIALCGADVVYELDDLQNMQQFNYDRCKDIRAVRTGIESLERAYENGEYYTSVCLRLYRTLYFNKKAFSFDEKHIHEDEAVGFLSYLQAERVEIISDKLYYRRVRSGSIMTEKKIQNSFEGYYCAWFSLKQYTLSCDDSRNIAMCNKRMIDYAIIGLHMYHDTDKNNKKLMADKCKEMCKYAARYSKSKRLKLASMSLWLYELTLNC